jgi:hypothetical protein
MATFPLHRLMISSRFMAMNSWSMHISDLADGMPELAKGVFKTAQAVIWCPSTNAT